MAAEHEHEPEVLIHGDSHLDNLFEETDGTPGFYDPQIARGPWSMEFAYNVIGGLEVADRRAWERPLLAFYLERLKGYGVQDAPAFEDAWRAYVRDIAHDLFIWLKNESYFQGEPVNTANTVRFGAAAVDCGTFEMLS